MLTLNHGYQKLAGMVGVSYQTAMSGLEGEAKMMGGLVLMALVLPRPRTRKSRIYSHKSTLRLAAMIVSKAPSCGWSWPHSIQLYRSIW